MKAVKLTKFAYCLRLTIRLLEQFAPGVVQARAELLVPGVGQACAKFFVPRSWPGTCQITCWSRWRSVAFSAAVAAQSIYQAKATRPDFELD